jgi:hypothetical protein
VAAFEGGIEMTSRRMLAAMVCASMTLAIAGSANAATYTGRAVDDPQTRIEFEKTGGEIRDFEVRRVRLRCFTGESFRDGTVFGPMPIEGNRFEGDYSSKSGQQAGYVFGSLEGGGRAKGWLRITATFDDNNTCTTRRVAWRAHRI